MRNRDMMSRSLVMLTLLAGLVTKMKPAVQRAHDRTIEYLSPEERDFFMLQMIRLVEANNERTVAPLRLPES
jgi:hypothetical protein